MMARHIPVCQERQYLLPRRHTLAHGLCFLLASYPHALSALSRPGGDRTNMPGSARNSNSDPNRGFLQRAHSVFAFLGGLYLVAVIFLSIPFFQIHVLYLNHLRLPLFADFNAPEKYGLARESRSLTERTNTQYLATAGSTLNTNITTADGVTLGAWFILSDPAYQAIPFPEPADSPSLESRIPNAIKSHPTVLFFHGNAGTRALGPRVRYYDVFTSRLKANVLAIDYRGFGNSEGKPTEEGLALDATAAWEWLIAHGADPENVLIYGHSLGTAVAAKLSADLSAKDIHYRGTVLMAPFSSIHKLLETYNFFGLVPLMKPLQMIPGAHDFVVRAMVHTFNTLPVVPLIKAPLLLVHAENDWDVPATHSATIFDSLLEPLLPPISPPPLAASSWTETQWSEFYAAVSVRAKAREAIVREVNLPNVGTLSEFTQSNRGKVVMLKTDTGGHNGIGWQATPMADDPSERPASPTPSIPTATFVYPVRSLLSGIQPQSSEQPAQYEPTGQEDKLNTGREQSTRLIEGKAGDNSAESPTDAFGSASLKEGPSQPAISKRRKTGGRPSRRTKHTMSPNFRHYPAGDSATLPPQFISNTQASSSSSSMARSHSPVYVPGPMGEPVPLDLPPPTPETGQIEYDCLSHVSDLASDTFNTVQPSSLSSQDYSIPFNPSEYGLVHLPPISRSDSSSSARSLIGNRYSTAPSSQGSNRRMQTLNPDSGPSSSSHIASSHSSARESDSAPGSQSDSPSRAHSPPPGSFALSERGSKSLSEHGSRSLRTSISDQAPESSGGSSTGFPLITMRYQHKEDENGHHLVIGREGQLARCEDEPIRTPGAVQGFGVLIAVDEDSHTGNLVVRQVSENSTELLGLSPKFLFSLECFTETLPLAQSDTLWENIQFLREPDPDQEDSPHIFTLSGWGQDGSAIAGQPSELGRRFWTCWCAVHRPQTSETTLENPNGVSGTIILEFELERDTHNPLYPIQSDVPDVSGASSPSTVDSSAGDSSSGGDMTGGSSTDGSGRTLVSRDESHTTRSLDSVTSSIMGHHEPGPLENTPETEVNTPNATPDVPGTEYVDISADPSTCMPCMKNATTTTTDSGSSSNSSPDAGRPDVIQSPSENASTSLKNDANALAASTSTPAAMTVSPISGLTGDSEWLPTAQQILESTTSHSKPIPALERLRKWGKSSAAPAPAESANLSVRARRAAARARAGGNPNASSNVGMMDVFAVMTQINEQLDAAPDLGSFLKVVAGVIKDLSQFHRVLVYQFDDMWNGQVVAELVDWNQTHDLFQGLHFPASDIPAQARQLYSINKVRLLYDRSQQTARIVVRSKEDLETPLVRGDDLEGVAVLILSQNMTHCYLRAMSPIHIKYLGNMGVRASMSVSIMAFGQLWGLIACHSYGTHRMRVSFPVRQMLRLLSQSISRNIERLSYAQRLQTRKLINTMASENHPTGQIVSNADDLLGLFEADYGILVIGEGAKILGPNLHGQDILVMAEYLRLKQFDTIQVSQSVIKDFPDLELSTGLAVIAGLLYVPLSSGGKDFIAFLRKGQPKEVHWAGRPQNKGSDTSLEPRKSFKIWSETVSGRSRAWTDEHMETASVLALVYGKFIEVWRQKESALQTTKLTNILLSNASHEVRTPLNHIINYLEMALDGPLDVETRDNLNMSHAASKSLLFTINDLLDLTRLESGHETSLNESFDLKDAIEEATRVYKNEASRRNIEFTLDVSNSPGMVIGDIKKIKTVVANLTANSCLGLAVVARIVEQLGGQLRVDSKVDQGSQFSFLIPLALPNNNQEISSPSGSKHSGGSSIFINSSRGSGRNSVTGSAGSDIDGLVEALQSNHMASPKIVAASSNNSLAERSSPLGQTPSAGQVEVVDSGNPIRPVKIDLDGTDLVTRRSAVASIPPALQGQEESIPNIAAQSNLTSRAINSPPHSPKLRVLIVEDNDINRKVLGKRLSNSGHIVVNTTNGQECLDTVQGDREYDCILMDIQMPIMNGFDATVGIRKLEEDPVFPSSSPLSSRPSHELNGRIPIFAVSASLTEQKRHELRDLGMDGWILKPIDFKRLDVILRGIIDPLQRDRDVYHPGCSWEIGGWFTKCPTPIA
ncbi:hypothetical protein HWV62_33533 [Athelia sp. TMB]|nr:hypothetical protein HWV62_33533 [Athelia sp. TMB]